MPWHFPARNRIISGLSRAVLVVEAGMRSGAMITAEYAIDYERPLFAVPGSILTEVSAGCNQLLAEGTATFARDAGDVLCELGLTVPPVGVSRATDDESAALLAVLEADDGFADGGWLEVEEIAARGLVIDALVNNAGYGVPGQYLKTTWERHSAFLNIMVVAVTELTRQLLDAERASR